MRVRVIHNPMAAGGRKASVLEAVTAQLEAEGVILDMRPAFKAGEAAQLVQETDKTQVDRILVAGGDGTINDALQGLHKDSPPLAILPTGTANVLAHELGLPHSASELANYVLHGTPQRVYPGRVNNRRFFSMASAGSDARAVMDLPRSAKRRWGKLAYLVYGIASFLRHGSPSFVARVDGVDHDVSLVIANRGKRYGGNHILAPSAQLREASLVVTLFPPARRTRTFLRLAGVAFGATRKPSKLPQVMASRLDLSAPQGAPIQADGDIVAKLPATIDVDPEPVLLVLPEG